MSKTSANQYFGISDATAHIEPHRLRIFNLSTFVHIFDETYKQLQTNEQELSSIINGDPMKMFGILRVALSR